MGADPVNSGQPNSNATPPAQRFLSMGRVTVGESGSDLRLTWSLLQPFVALAAVVLVFVICQLALGLNPFLTRPRLTLVANQTAIPAMGVWA